MPTFNVTEIISSRPWAPPGESEPKTIYYEVKLDGENRPVSVGRKPGNPLAVGAVLEGEITTDDRGGLKFKRSSNGFGGGGPRPRDPKESAVIVQQHSQAMALRYAELQQAQGKLPEDFNLNQVLVIAAKFAADAKAATP